MASTNSGGVGSLAGGFLTIPTNWGPTNSPSDNIVPLDSDGGEGKGQGTSLFTNALDGFNALLGTGLDTWQRVNVINSQKRIQEYDQDLRTQGYAGSTNFKQNNVLGLFAIAGIVAVAAWAILRK